ncbi:MAG: 6-carboxytetrahydropterin synthase QueD [Bdellovibrionaceae bacterium]|nr:6-carboxytetrahydropterin synthase QueD [Pseudobdellovibrionaceae bacterium]MDW8190385.1 6-carboxytetrahydropterin synthase QueD [Pseudobdellovibrionaceae bacterium]
MMFEIRQTFYIDSARYLPHLPSSHPCSRVHGHRFQITLILHGPLTQEGWVMDYHQIAQTVEPIKQKLDHRLLNEISGLNNPTSEHLAAYIYHEVKAKIPLLVQVIVKETAESECRYPSSPVPI